MLRYKFYNEEKNSWIFQFMDEINHILQELYYPLMVHRVD